MVLRALWWAVSLRWRRNSWRVAILYGQKGQWYNSFSVRVTGAACVARALEDEG